MSSISPRTSVGAFVVAALKIVTTIRSHGVLSWIVGRKLYSVPSLRVTVASPLSGAVSSCIRPSGNVTLIVTTGACDWAAANMPVSTMRSGNSTPFRNIGDRPASEELVAPGETLVDPGAQVIGRNAVNLVWTFVADQ